MSNMGNYPENQRKNHKWVIHGNEIIEVDEVNDDETLTLIKNCHPVFRGNSIQKTICVFKENIFDTRIEALEAMEESVSHELNWIKTEIQKEKINEMEVNSE